MAILRASNEYDHAVGASLDYGLDYSAWLRTGEQIVDSSWEVTEGVTLSDEQATATAVACFVTGGTRGSVYYLTNTITTSSTPPRIDSRTLVLSCKRM